VTYVTDELVLTLSNKGDVMRYNGDQEAQSVDCE
jgi:hypothetical protein